MNSSSIGQARNHQDRNHQNGDPLPDQQAQPFQRPAKELPTDQGHKQLELAIVRDQDEKHWVHVLWGNESVGRPMQYFQPPAGKLHTIQGEEQQKITTYMDYG